LTLVTELKEKESLLEAARTEQEKAECEKEAVTLRKASLETKQYLEKQ